MAIVQIMSGRSESNSLLLSTGGEMLTRRDNGKVLGAAPAYKQILDNYEIFTLQYLIIRSYKTLNLHGQSRCQITHRDWKNSVFCSFLAILAISPVLGRELSTWGM